MPFVTVNWLATRTREEKQILVHGIGEAFEKSGTPAEYIHVIFNDVPRSNWGEGGTAELPFVTVNWWATRTQEEKKILVRGIADAFSKAGTPAGNVHIIVNDVPKSNWAEGGELASEKYPNRRV